MQNHFNNNIIKIQCIRSLQTHMIQCRSILASVALFNAAVAYHCCDTMCCKAMGQIRCMFHINCSWDKSDPHNEMCRMVPEHMEVWCKHTPKDNILQTHSFKHAAAVTSVSIDPMEAFIVTGSADGMVQLWPLDDSDPGKLPQPPKADAPVTSVAYSMNLLAYAQQMGKTDSLRVRVYMLQWEDGKRSWKKVSIDQQHENEVTCVRISRDGKRIVTGGYDGQVVVYQRDDESEMNFSTLIPFMYYDSENELKGPVSSVAFSHDGNLIAIGGALKTVEIFNVQEKKFTTTREASSWSWISDVVVSVGQGNSFIIGDATKTDVELVENGHAQSYCDSERSGEGTHWSSMALSLDQRFVAAGSWDQYVTVWDRAPGPGKAYNSTKAMRRFKHADRVNAIAITDSNRYIVSVSNDNTAAVWQLDAETNASLALVALSEQKKLLTSEKSTVEVQEKKTNDRMMNTQQEDEVEEKRVTDEMDEEMDAQEDEEDKEKHENVEESGGKTENVIEDTLKMVTF